MSSMAGQPFRVTPLGETDLDSDVTIEDISFVDRKRLKRGSTNSSLLTGCSYDVFDEEKKNGHQKNIENMEYIQRTSVETSKGNGVYAATVGAFFLVVLTAGCMYTIGGGSVNLRLNSGMGSGNKVVVQQEKLGVPLPAVYQHFLDVNSTTSSRPVPVVWDMPGDGDVLQQILSRCVGLVAAGGAFGDERQTLATDEPLRIFTKRHGTYVNCFAGSKAGIDRIIQMGLYQSKLADVLYTPLIHDIGRSFDEEHSAAMITMFHDPVQRVATVFHVIQQTIPKFRNKSLKDFLHTTTGKQHSNWMTRQLSNCGLDELNEECLRVAKEIVEKKCLVGLTSDIETSLELIIDRMGWATNDNDFFECSTKLENGIGLDRLYNDLVEPESPDYELIVEHNKFDLELYETAKAVFARAL